MTPERLEKILKERINFQAEEKLGLWSSFKPRGKMKFPKKVEGAIITRLLSGMLMGNEWNEYLRVVLSHPEGVSELTRLINEGWHFLGWPYPREYPDCELAVAAFKAPGFTPPYPFIRGGKFMIDIKEEYKSREYFQEVYIFSSELEEDLRRSDRVLALDRLESKMVPVSSELDIQFAIKESLAWFRTYEHEFV